MNTSASLGEPERASANRAKSIGKYVAGMTLFVTALLLATGKPAQGKQFWRDSLRRNPRRFGISQ
jgi:hypothetical protein